ncbi:MAG: NifB/NifX family molybdenum-iron cluster-binding protein [Candidatus Thorarchaeota archaeon]
MTLHKIAVPAISEQGLDSPISAHFGHSPMFVISTVEDGRVVEVETLRNAGHSSCAEPVMALADRGIKVLIVAGMGGRPYMVTQQVGISVIKAEGATVREALNSYLEGIASDMRMDALCGGKSKRGCSGEPHNH